MYIYANYAVGEERVMICLFSVCEGEMYDWVQKVAKRYFDNNPDMKNTNKGVIDRIEMLCSPFEVKEK